MNFSISKDSTLRAVRTLYQGFIALAVVAPILVTLAPAGTPLAAAAASMVAAVAVVSKLLNALEAAGIKLPFYPPAVPAPADVPVDPAAPPVEDIDPTQPPAIPTIDPAP